MANTGGPAGVTVAAFVQELRAIGIRVSLSENIDAMAALLVTPISSRDSLKSALSSTLVKSSDHFGAFELVFDIFFSESRLGDGAQLAVEPPPATGAADGSAGQSVISALTDAQLSDLLLDAVLAADRLLIRATVAEAVKRYAWIEAGRAVAGIQYMYRTLNKLDLESLLEKLIATVDRDVLGPLDYMLAVEEYGRRIDQVRLDVDSAIRRILVADRGTEAVAGTLRRPLPEDVDFLNASVVQLAAIRQALQPLSKKLAARLANKRRHQRASKLDFRRTIRGSVGNGGAAIDLIFQKPRPAKPEIMLIADVSPSVAAFAAFTLQLAYAIRSEFSKVRSFVFVDGIDEVTGVLESAPDIAYVAHHINSGTTAVRLDGHSDYGLALEGFWNSWGQQVKARTTVIILGDARNNYHSPQSWVLKAIRERSRHLYWLNPEPSYSWDSGDSVMSEYSQYCEKTVECRSLRQLRAFVAELD